MRALPFKQVDVFTARGFRGNPVAIVADADVLAADEMRSASRPGRISRRRPFVRLESEADVASLAPDLTAVEKLSREHALSGIAAFAFVEGGEFAVHIGCSAPAFGVPEDPLTGSANAALPAYLARHGLLERSGLEYLATQETEKGRDGRVAVRVLDAAGRAEIGGQAVTLVEGELRVDDRIWLPEAQ